MDKLPTHIQQLVNTLSNSLYFTSSRNYYDGSVLVKRGDKIIGLCFDNESETALDDLIITPELFPHLQDIVIRSTSLSTLPDWLFHFPYLENLILKNIQLTQVTDLLEAFPKLKFLALPDNKLKEWDSSINHPSLFRVNLNHNLFEEFPEQLCHLPNLVALTINDNFINKIDYKIKSSSIQSLSIKNNQVEVFPDFLRSQIHLYNLDLSSNFIPIIPGWIEEFSSLEHLNLSYNQIRSLPSSFSQLVELKFLNLGHNQELTLDPSLLYSLNKLQEIKLNHSLVKGEQLDKIVAYIKLTESKIRLIY